MNGELIVDIVLSLLLGTMHLSTFLIILVWRFKNFVKNLHSTIPGYEFFVLSFLFGVLLPLGGFTFLDGGTAGTKSLVLGVFVCPPALFIAIRLSCFCIYIDKDYAIKKTLFKVVRIYLKDPETVIIDRRPYSKLVNIGIISKNNDAILFNGLFIEGNVSEFMDKCSIIHNKSDD